MWSRFKMIQSMRHIRNQSTSWLITLMVATVLTVSPASSQTMDDSSSVDDSIVLQLITDSGLAGWKSFMSERELPPEYFSDPHALLYIVAPETKEKLIKEIYSGIFDVEEYFDAVELRFRKNLSPEKAQKVLEFFASPLGIKSVAMVAKFRSGDSFFSGKGKSFLNDFRDQLGSENLPTGQRLILTNRLIRAMELVNYDLRLMRSVLSTVSPLNPYIRHEASSRESQKFDNELPEYVKTARVLTFFRIFQKLSDNNLKDLVRFYESGPGRWYQRTLNRGALDAQDRMNRQARLRVASLLKAFQQGEGDKEVFRDMFPPGVRQLFVRKRDPFEPLVLPPGKQKKKKVEVIEIPVDRFAGKESRLTSIPMEGYEMLKEMDPQLYQDLEFYGKLFQERSDLEALTEEEFEEEVKRYESLIERAREVIAEAVTTPIQIDFGELLLAGLLTSSGETVALLQTEDEKGYLVRPGMLIGPKFGKIEAITPDGIEVIERGRDHEGNIQTNTKRIEFPREEEESDGKEK